MKREGRFEIVKGRGAQPWRWRWYSRNGKCVARSNEGHPSRALARKSATSVKFGALQSPVKDEK